MNCGCNFFILLSISLSCIHKTCLANKQTIIFNNYSIKHLYIDEAKPVKDGSEPALAVETCTCPPGYTGLSCEVFWLVIS